MRSLGSTNFTRSRAHALGCGIMAAGRRPQPSDLAKPKGGHVVIDGFILSFGNAIGLVPDTDVAAVANTLSKPAPGRKMLVIRRNMRIRCRASGSSSTMSTRIFMKPPW